MSWMGRKHHQWPCEMCKSSFRTALGACSVPWTIYVKTRLRFAVKGDQPCIWRARWKSLLCSLNWQSENLGKCTLSHVLLLCLSRFFNWTHPAFGRDGSESQQKLGWFILKALHSLAVYSYSMFWSKMVKMWPLGRSKHAFSVTWNSRSIFLEKRKRRPVIFTL